MIIIENIQIVGFEPAIRGMRNPMNSWKKSDTTFYEGGVYHDICGNSGPANVPDDCDIIMGHNDHDLMMSLAKQGAVHGKFRRMIVVYVDITAPLYWWKEFDTYKVGTVANSCSTMHKIHAKEFSLEDFSHEHLLGEGCIPDHAYQNPHDILSLTVESLNFYRQKFLETGSEIKKCHFNELEKREELGKRQKQYWWQMIQLLPSSYNQKRTVMLNYEVLSNIYQHRRNHKLNEWRELCKWIEGLPYSEVITCNAAKQEEDSSIVAAITKLKNEQWSTEDIVALLLGQTKKEYMKLFSDDTDKMPVHGGAFEIPAVMADNTKND